MIIIIIITITGVLLCFVSLQLTCASVAAVQIILLTNEPILVDYIQLLSRRQLLTTHDAREALEVEHFVPRSPHEVVGGDPQRAPAALCAETSATEDPILNVSRVTSDVI